MLFEWDYTFTEPHKDTLTITTLSKISYIFVERNDTLKILRELARQRFGTNMAKHSLTDNYILKGDLISCT